MATDRANDLRAFLDFAVANLAGDGVDLTLDEALTRWELEHETEAEKSQTIQAVREGLDDLRAGRSRPFDEFDREFRERHGIPHRS